MYELKELDGLNCKIHSTMLTKTFIINETGSIFVEATDEENEAGR